MSDAKVQFLTIEGEPCEPRSAQRFTFQCVRRKDETCARLLIANSGHGVKRDPNNQNGGRAQWDWDGNEMTPTFAPSVNCASACGWHGYVRAGRCVEVDGRDS